MKFIIWNGRGISNTLVYRNLKEIVQLHQPSILALMETKGNSSKAPDIAKSLKFSRVEVVEGDGFSGGLWLFWKEETVNLEVITTNF